MKNTFKIADKPGMTAEQLTSFLRRHSTGLKTVEPELVAKEVLNTVYDGMSSEEFSASLLMSAKSFIEKDPEYSFFAARLLNEQLTTEVQTHTEHHPNSLSGFWAYLSIGVENKLLSPDMLLFDIPTLHAAIKHSRDRQFTYLGLQTLYDRYFLHVNKKRIETPQNFFMRVAMGLSINEENKDERAIEFYNLLSSFDYMSSTPTLFNAGTLRPQLSSCYLTTVPDDLKGIYGAISDNAMLSKWSGGLGNDWTRVRSLGAHIQGTNGDSQGVVPFLKVANDTAVAVNQGGKRKGAVCAYLETWHLDIEEFLELRKNTGDDRRRTHDMNTANWIPDLFMERMLQGANWTLFSPHQVPDLHDLYGEAFKERYEHYEQLAKTDSGLKSKEVSALQLWRKMLGMIFETGHPWITFKDPINIRNPQKHVGVVHSSNLCTEITLNTSDTEVAVCNLGSVNIANHLLSSGAIDQAKLEATVTTAVRMLDNVVDINFYPVPQAENSNKKHRPIGLGMMGFQDALYKMGISYNDKAAVAFAGEFTEAMSYYAIQTSMKLAQEKGSYSSFKGSEWSKGNLPLDTSNALDSARGQVIRRAYAFDWRSLSKLVAANGMRNSNVTAIAPTATIANIVGVTQSIEPTYQNLFVKSNLSGEFTVINNYLVQALKDAGVWDAQMINDLKVNEGSVQNIPRVPQKVKDLFVTSFEVDINNILDAAAERQIWLDQAQSLNLYIANASGKALNDAYVKAWKDGLKTTYYLRALAATTTEKSSVNTSTLNAVSANPVPAACSIDDPDCEACQ